MDASTLLLFAATEFLASLSPGPAVLLIVGLAMRRGFRQALFGSVGVIATNALYFGMSALGVGALILASAALFTVLKIAGGLYLIWIGLQMIRRWIVGFRSGGGAGFRPEADAGPGPEEGAVSLMWRGFAVQAANPKNLVFFVAILPQFVTPGGDVAMQLMMLGAVSVLLELPILLLYALAFSSLARVMTGRVIQTIEAAAGAFMVAIGGTLMLSRKG